jgi:hypothetical protein
VPEFAVKLRRLLRSTPGRRWPKGTERPLPRRTLARLRVRAMPARTPAVSVSPCPSDRVKDLVTEPRAGLGSVQVVAHYERLSGMLDLREQQRSGSGTPCNILD